MSTIEDEPERWLVDMPDSKESRIDTCRRIIRDKAFDKIDGAIVDMMTANMLVTVWDALSEPSREKFETIPLTRLVKIGWKACRG